MTGIRTTFLLATALLLGGHGGPVASQETAERVAPLSFEEFFERLDAQPDDFARFRFLSTEQVAASPALDGIAAQLRATQYSFLGRPNDAIRAFPIHSRAPAPPGLPGPGTYRAVTAAGWIAGEAADFRVVMVNEAHHKPQTRLLTFALLPKLRALGFTHFAAETFGERPLAAGYPVSGTGYYSAEPVFAELVRRAAALGFTLVPYESVDGDSQQSRETGQAARLAEVLARDPDARILVHAGYGHISEEPGTQPQGADPMALELERLTGLQVLTLDQTGLAWEDGKAAERMAEAFGIASPSVLLDRTSDRAWSAFPARFDASVVLPAVDASVLRPAWLALDGFRAPVASDLTPCIGHLPCLVQARYAGEGDDAIPADQFMMLDPGESTTPLYLAPGRYRLRLVGDAGQFLSGSEFAVPAAPTETKH